MCDSRYTILLMLHLRKDKLSYYICRNLTLTPLKFISNRRTNLLSKKKIISDI